MDHPEQNTSVRRYLAHVGLFGTTQLHLRNPYIIVGWSLLFPGFGHLLLSKYVRGYLLFIWEIFVNVNAHVNLALFYSFTGRFEMAKDVLDINWVLLYIPTYLFAVWDSYRTTVDLNHQYKLAAREDAEVKMFNISQLEINYLDQSYTVTYQFKGEGVLWGKAKAQLIFLGDKLTSKSQMGIIKY